MPSAQNPPKMDRAHMREVSALNTVEPFGKVNYWDIPNNGGRMIRATILMEKPIEGARMGIAIDGSGSMEDLFGKKAVAKFLPTPPNQVRDTARAMSAYLARRSVDGKVAAIYWATGPGGREIEVLGDLTAQEAEKFDFGPPKHYGTGTQLAPALRYFTEQRTDLLQASWGMYVFITDGQIEDMDAVKSYCTTLARDIDAGRRSELKLVIIGLGTQVDERQLDELDDFDPGVEVDLWDAKLAVEMKELSEIFAEVVDEATIIVPRDGIIRDHRGSVVVDYRDNGLPAVLEFVLPVQANSFSLEVAGNTTTQPLP